MTLLVPFDGSDLARAALERAVEFSEYTGQDVLALSVLPDDADYAVERGWIDEGESYDPAAVADRFERQVTEIAPAATFRAERPADVSSMADVTTDVVRTIREVSHEIEASIVFIGSENAGRVSTPVCSVGAPISEDPEYDVHIVRHAA
ncbi:MULTISPECIES: universal stress protein [Halomicrobium]|uniref:Universal stress protein n=1 Tax=Halomicrobium mukohataei TaxID=57705 RepID=A0A847UAC0_9EURY|nr:MULTISPECIES: universal stress protein [Halomicrobium]MBO4249116.1 universal stress protein [Halomicrobium sp. IBSBa]NLV09949.1 universal stress protein [Halomicrobium mukohataei]QGA81765.1 Nucleotide-binding protein, UspA family [Halomicrobium sp. LC1Hm]